MTDLKTLRKRARGCLKRHYVLLVILCAASVFLGTEFNEIVSNCQTWYDIVTDRDLVVDTDGMPHKDSLWFKIIDDLINDNIAAGQEEAAERMEALRDNVDIHSALGRQRGVLASLVNNISSGNLYAMIATALHNAFHSRQFAAMLMVLVGTAVYLLIWIFLRNAYSAVLRRAALEARCYSVVPAGHLLHLRLVKRWRRASLTLLLTTLFQTLWDLTIVGGWIKHYSYFLVPYIVAENPDIRPREAVNLSRRMMDGHKWECFRLDLTFLGWRALGFVTFGALDLLWGVPYRLAAYTEYYVELRQQAIEEGVPGAERLNDEYLYAHAEAAVLRGHYADIARNEEIIDEDIVELPPVKRFFARNFGIWMGSLMEKKVYSAQVGLRKQTRVERLEMNGQAYPRRMNPLWDKEQSGIAGRISYLTPCTVWTLVIVFFAFCMVGWLWEVVLFLVKYGKFANRGMLHGPWLPIYGSGVVMIAVLLNRFRSKPALEAAAIVVLCGFVEYMTSYVTELSTGMRWWDYTGYFLNLNGRICGEGLAVFALGGMAAVYLLLPIIDAMTTRVRPKLLVGVCVALLACFVADLVYSHFVPNAGEGITDEPDMAGLIASAAGDMNPDVIRANDGSLYTIFQTDAIMEVKA